MGIDKRINCDRLAESNDIARAQLSPPADSVWEERIIAQVTAFNRIKDTEFPATAFMIGQLVNSKKKISTRQLTEIQKAAKKLASTTFTLFRSEESFRTYPVFAYVDYDCGIITAQLNPELKPHYLQLKKQFAIRSLPGFKNLSSVYSQQIFRYINSWGRMAEALVSIEELHHVTAAPISLRSNFANFKARVLDVAHKEINAKTNLKYDWEPIKPGRRVIKIRFIFKSQTL